MHFTGTVHVPEQHIQTVKLLMKSADVEHPTREAVAHRCRIVRVVTG